MRWLHESMVGLQHSVDRTASLHNVALDSAGQSNIVICMYKHFKVQNLVDPFVPQGENTLQNDQGRPLYFDFLSLSMAFLHIASELHVSVLADFDVCIALG